ncbi:MAG TPA: hypothetical protein PLY94_05740 [Gemmatimonadaceae bacterium]|nr:hypothetical protein [Gemmatimonadaceae bacterium]
MTVSRIASRLAVRLLPVLLVTLFSATLQAQGNRRTQMTVTGFSLTASGTTVADFDAGAITLGSTNFNVNLTTNSGAGGFSPRRTRVSVRCLTPCPNSGSAPLAGLQWRRADLAAWNTLTTSFVLVEERVAAYNGANDPWQNSMAWRYQLSYTGTPERPVTRFRIQYQLQVTAP